MTLTAALKKSTFAVLKGAGAFHIAARSNWRRQRLLILCFHGISMKDEHEFDPEMFLSAAAFGERLELLKKYGCAVLGLEEALARLESGTLPARSVALTFDDGMVNFHAAAWPLLESLGFPATVYMTTYYCLYNRPVFRLACAYMMWSKRDGGIRELDLPWFQGSADLAAAGQRSELLARIDRFAKEKQCSGAAKDELLAQFAAALDYDYAELCRSGLVQLMSPELVTQVARAGVDIQLHTHRHRTPGDRAAFRAEIEENRAHLRELAGDRRYVHFCYPSGAYQPKFAEWLRECGVQSASTCLSGLADRSSDPMQLPRLVDHSYLSSREFEAWISGVGALVYRRPQIPLEAAPE